MAADAKIASGEAIQSNNFKGVTSVKLRELRKPLNIATCWNVGEEYEYALVQNGTINISGVEVTVKHTNICAVIGLNKGSRSLHLNDIDFGMYFSSRRTSAPMWNLLR